jgi:type I restriction enzyme, S subunit
VPALQQGVLERIPVALPPLAEQHRIVAKVDELMALCDRLEVARADREATRDRLAAASLARLNAPDPDPATFADHARFALESLAALTTRPDQVKQLRQTILNLAVIGKLTDTRNDRHPALVELRAVEAKKLELALRKPKPIAAVSLEEQ